MDKRFEFCFEKNGSEKLVLRFDPERSRLHRFGDENPTDWSGVYKVYYFWGIYYVNGGKTEYIGGANPDECSPFHFLPEVIEDMAQYNRDSNQMLYPAYGGAWQVTTHRGEKGKGSFFTLDVWSYPGSTELSCFSRSIRMEISREKALELARFIRWVNEYMFRHSVPI